MEAFVFLLKEWHPVMQFIFMAILVVAVFFIVTTIFLEISKFFNYTLPIICRGWPPEHINKDDDTEENEN